MNKFKEFDMHIAQLKSINMNLKEFKMSMSIFELLHSYIYKVPFQNSQWHQYYHPECKNQFMKFNREKYL